MSREMREYRDRIAALELGDRLGDLSDQEHHLAAGAIPAREAPRPSVEQSQSLRPTRRSTVARLAARDESSGPPGAPVPARRHWGCRV
jgi:hypothetical protein